ncbi:MAG: translation initiation factor IF-2 N-terminal domain-containing protein, partial [Clostridia bacterium]|nr:translation initiation factor IF-2 N-terminal domain-containing protein [Clostridia bacterium]
MAVNQTLKINTLSKDLEVKSKVILDILAAAGIEGKTHSGTVNAEEFGLVLEHFTKENTIVGLDAYMNGQFKISYKKEEAPAPAVEEKPAKTESAAKAPEKKPEQKAEQKQDKKPAPKNQQNAKNAPGKDKMQRFQAPAGNNAPDKKKKPVKEE